MNRLLSSVGLIALLGFPSSMAVAQSAAPSTVYTRIKAQVQKEMSADAFDDDIVTFVRMLYKDTWNLTDEDVKNVLRGDPTKACATVQNGMPANDLVNCETLKASLLKAAQQEQQVRTLGRRLTTLVAGYELPLSDIPERTQHLSSDLLGIISIWSAGTGKVTDAPKAGDAPVIRTINVDSAAVLPGLGAVATALKALTPEERTAAVWRYQSGMRLVTGRRAPDFPAPLLPDATPNGTERQYLAKHWNKVEDALNLLWQMTSAVPINPPLAANEVAYVRLTRSGLPDNVIVWVRLDGDPKHRYGDAGLEWDLPLEPVFPSLKKDGADDVILGGLYPPEPVVEKNGKKEPLNGMQLCTNPLAIRGYLCHPFEVTEPREQCPDDTQKNGDTITLVHCTKTGSTLRYTAAGADVCREIDWKNPEPFDPNTQCRVTVRCANDCNNQPHHAYTSPKNPDGSIDVCVENRVSAVTPASYVVYHELVHAYQFCGQPPTSNIYTQNPPGASAQDIRRIRDENAERCCRVEGEAYRLQCDMMERDGVFAGISVGNIPINGQICGEVLTDAGCKEVEANGEKLPGCFLSMDYPANAADDIQKAMINNPKNVAPSCADAIDPLKMDPRVAALKESVERRDDVCTPATETNYMNRIGNNICYIGQCAEQSVELHRITGGRSPAVTQDGVSPFADPQTGTALGNLLSNPPLSQYRFPAYRPELLVRTLDEALCQSAGLPALMPPALCAAEATRQLQLTRVTGLETALGLVRQNTEQNIDLRDTLNLARGIGVRTGTELYSDYLRESSRSFAEVIGMATRLLEQLNTISFPTEMCPISPGLPTPAS